MTTWAWSLAVENKAKLVCLLPRHGRDISTPLVTGRDMVVWRVIDEDPRDRIQTPDLCPEHLVGFHRKCRDYPIEEQLVMLSGTCFS